MAEQTTIKLDGLRIGYGARTLFTATAEFRAGEFCALIGRNGTGKSSLLRVLASVDKPQGGTFEICGLNPQRLMLRERASLVSIVTTERINVTNLRVSDVVALGRSPHTGWLGSLTADDHRVVAKSLEKVGMTAFADKRVDTLSDGENARVMVARALAQNTPVMLLDEPTAFLDLAGKYELCKLLRECADDGKTILFSSHDLATVISTCSGIALISDGILHHGAITEMLASESMGRFFADSGMVFDTVSGVIKPLK